MKAFNSYTAIDTGLPTNDETVKTTIKLFKYDDPNVKLSCRPFKVSFNGFLNDWAKKERSKF